MNLSYDSADVKLAEMTLGEFNKRFPGSKVTTQEALNIAKLIGDAKTIQMLDIEDCGCVLAVSVTQQCMACRTAEVSDE